MLAILGGTIITSEEILTHKALLIKDKRIVDIVDPHDLSKEIKLITDYKDHIFFPGLIDSHIHGAMGKDTMDSTPEAIGLIGEYLATQGTTMWMPTTVSAPTKELISAIKNVANYQEYYANKYPNSAKVMGVFIESNFINETKKGAHPSSCLQPLNRELIQELLAAGPVKNIILAPELPNAAEFTKWITNQGVKVSLGHSSANYQESSACIQAGADAGVHTYCAMNSLHHREPGLLGATMINDQIYAELIADGIHVSIPAMEILRRSKPVDKLILVSDACQGTGLPDGNYMLGILPITVENGIARIENGALAGSTTTMLRSLRLMVKEMGVSYLDMAKYTSLNPATRYGLAEDYGSITPGKFADFIILDEDLNLRATWINGHQVHTA